MSAKTCNTRCQEDEDVAVILIRFQPYQFSAKSTRKTSTHGCQCIVQQQSIGSESRIRTCKPYLVHAVVQAHLEVRDRNTQDKKWKQGASTIIIKSSCHI